MYVNAKRPAWAEINLTNLDFNIKSIQAKVTNQKSIMGIIKADGYGHGASQVASVLRANNIASFGVATLDEAIALRNDGFQERIVILGITPSLYSKVLLDYSLTAVVSSLENAEAISEAAQKESKRTDIFIAIDTGMGRIGYLADDFSVVNEIKKIAALPNLNILGLFSHFATADSLNKNFAHRQEMAFTSFYNVLRGAGVNLPSRTFANSAAIMELPSTHFDVVRPGIVLYGCYPSDEVDKRKLEIKPVMSVKANIVHLKKVPANFSVGYGQKFISTRESVIATITLGYADGYPRPYSSVGRVIVNGKFAPLAGSICMDQCMVDVTDVPGTEVGDQVILMGSDGTLSISADDIAKATGTINYEILCAFGQRLPRVYVK